MNYHHLQKALLFILGFLLAITPSSHSFPMEWTKERSNSYEAELSRLAEEQERSRELSEPVDNYFGEENREEIFEEREKEQLSPTREQQNRLSSKTIFIKPILKHPSPQQIALLAQYSTRGHQERKVAEPTLKSVSFDLAPPKITPQEFVERTSLGFENIKRSLKQALKLVPSDEEGKQDTEEIAAHYRKAYDDASTLLREFLSELENTPSLHDEQTALLITDMMIQTIKIAARSVPFENIKPLKGVAWNYDRYIKVPFEISSKKISILEEEHILIANTTESSLMDLQESKKFLKLPFDYPSNKTGEKFRQLFLNKNMRISALLSDEKIINRLKHDNFSFNKNAVDELTLSKSQIEEKHELTCKLASQNDEKLSILFNTPPIPNLNLNQAKKEVIKDILETALSKLKAADQFLQMLMSRRK